MSEISDILNHFADRLIESVASGSLSGELQVYIGTWTYDPQTGDLTAVLKDLGSVAYYMVIPLLVKACERLWMNIKGEEDPITTQVVATYHQDVDEFHYQVSIKESF